MTVKIYPVSSAVLQVSLPVPGEIVAEKYRIERTLGIGGMGAVFEVTHCITHKQFAIKWLLQQSGDTVLDRKRFIREAQIAGRIKHPNVIEVYDVYQEDSGVFLVMELLEGESLAARLDRGALGLSDALAILLPSLDGVAAAHDAGVVHRDIKPANIFLCRGRGTESVHPKVVDFGVSRFEDAPHPSDLATTRSGTVIGTPHYMAPEQMRAAVVDGRADVYSLGVTLYEMLAGVRPYDAATYPELVLRIAAGRARPLREHVPDLPRGLSEIVSRAMAPDPKARFASVREFMQALVPYAQAPAGPQRMPSQSYARALRPTARRRAALALVVGLAVSIAAWFVIARNGGSRRGEAAKPVPTAESSVRPATATEPTRELRAPDPAPAASNEHIEAPQSALEAEPVAPVRPAPDGAKPQRPTGYRKPVVQTDEPAGQRVGRARVQPLPPPKPERPSVKLERSGF